ncbi:MAG: exodeoxyribonuclease VII small subunit [Gammaproteobacteria bacterium]|nr:exodeoxyribonuclease VII small subunit [Gammaproteobacteria bacterium]TVQ47379.1 MAG: exodeoxyribonuclease VII small subunit [Gammaproteobacteria bacterium]
MSRKRVAPEAPPAEPPAEAVDFEQALEALEGLVERLEGGELPLEQALSAFEEGVRLTRECQRALRAAEQKVAMLTGEGETAEPEPFQAAD